MLLLYYEIAGRMWRRRRRRRKEDDDGDDLNPNIHTVGVRTISFTPYEVAETSSLNLLLRVGFEPVFPEKCPASYNSI